MENLNSKKFVLACLVVACGAVFVATKQFTADQFKSLVEWTFTTFVVGNTVSKFAEK